MHPGTKVVVGRAAGMPLAYVRHANRVPRVCVRHASRMPITFTDTCTKTGTFNLTC